VPFRAEQLAPVAASGWGDLGQNREKSTMPAERSSGERTAGALTSQAATRASGQLPAGAKPRRQHTGGRGCAYAAVSPLPERCAVGRAPSAASRAGGRAQPASARGVPRPPRAAPTPQRGR